MSSIASDYRDRRHARRPPDGRRMLAAMGLVAALWSLAVIRRLAADMTVPWDAKNQFFAFFKFLNQSLHDGTSPFWNPYHFGGHPSIADPQSLLFQPPFLLWAWLDRAPTVQAFDVLVMAHLLAGGLAIAGLGRSRGWSPWASLLAAAVFMFGGPAAGRLSHVGIITAYGLFPVALLFLERALHQRSRPWALAFAVVAAMIALGRNQVALMLCLMLVAALVGHVLTAERPVAYLRERAGLIALIAVTGAVLLAVPLLLTLQFATLSNRPAVSLANALQASLHPSSLATLAVPDIFGTHLPDYGYWGPHYSILPEVAASDDSTSYLFVGTTTIVLLLAGLASGMVLRKGSRLALACLIAALVFAVGRYTPLYPFVFEHLPGFAYFRRPNDALFAAVIALAILCGHLLHDFERDGLARTSRWRAAAVVVAIAGLLGWGIVVSSMTGHARQAALQVASILPVALLALTALLLPRTPHARAAAAAVLAMATSAELMSWNAVFRLNAEDAEYYRVIEGTPGRTDGALQTLTTELEARRRAGERPRVEILGLGGPWQNLAMVRGIEATNGYNPLRVGIYDRFVAPGEEADDPAGRAFPSTFPAFDCALAHAIGLEYLVLDRPIEKVRPLLVPKLAQTLRNGPDVWIYRLQGTMPRVSFTTGTVLTDSEAPPPGDDLAEDDSIPELVDNGEDTSFAHLHMAVWAPSSEPQGNTARIVSWQPGRIAVVVDAPTAGQLVLHDIHYPGWVAEVDGRPTPIRRADILFRGLEIPAGRHVVVFRFKPLSLANLAAAARDVLRRQ